MVTSDITFPYSALSVIEHYSAGNLLFHSSFENGT
jgi:hypothetical protein